MPRSTLKPPCSVEESRALGRAYASAAIECHRAEFFRRVKRLRRADGEPYTTQEILSLLRAYREAKPEAIEDALDSRTPVLKAAQFGGMEAGDGI